MEIPEDGGPEEAALKKKEKQRVLCFETERPAESVVSSRFL